jgi:copper chaperone
MNELRFMIPGMSCGHCVDAITGEISSLAGVAGVEIDLDTK